jgi:hypothetical protein
VEVASRSAALILERKVKNMTSRKKMDFFLEKHGNREEELSAVLDNLFISTKKSRQAAGFRSR